LRYRPFLMHSKTSRQKSCSRNKSVAGHCTRSCGQCGIEPVFVCGYVHISIVATSECLSVCLCRPVSVHMQYAYFFPPSVPIKRKRPSILEKKRGGGNRTAHVAQIPFLPEMPQVIQQKVCCSTNVAPVRLIEHLEKKIGDNQADTQ
jgi:hypothetical protein